MYCQEIYSRRRYCTYKLTSRLHYAWSGHNDKLTVKSVRGRWLLYSQHRREKKKEERIVRMWQRSSNLETLGGRERSLRGLYVSEQESEGDHRPIAAQWQEPPRGDKDTCDFNSLLLSPSEGARPACLHPGCASNTVGLRFITARPRLGEWQRVCMRGSAYICTWKHRYQRGFVTCAASMLP